MESAATPTKPKRVRAAIATLSNKALAALKADDDAKPRRYRKVTVEETQVATMTHRERMAAVDARAAETRKRVEAEYAEKGYGQMPRTGIRWMGRRTKGLPFSRMVIDHVSPGMHGLPGIIHAKHPTRKRPIKTLVATQAILQTFMPSLPPGLAAAMLGTN